MLQNLVVLQKTILFSLFFTLLNIGFCQEPLAFDVLDYEPAFCRLYYYQNGNGVVYASATGGVPDYTYQWTNLENGTTSPNATWGGRNPGCYEIKVTDDIGNTITDTICVDSLNPIAILELESDDLVETEENWYAGVAPVTATFFNYSENYYQWTNPVSDSSIFFQPQGFEPWIEYIGVEEILTYTYEYGGVYTATLIASNSNGCADTAYKTLDISGLLEVNEEGKSIHTYIDAQSRTFVIENHNLNEPLQVEIYSLNGKLMVAEELNKLENRIDLNFSSGLYLYRIYQVETGNRIKQGKLHFAN